MHHEIGKNTSHRTPRLGLTDCSNHKHLSRRRTARGPRSLHQMHDADNTNKAAKIFHTCLRLEEVYWDVLSDISRSNECSINALLSYIDREIHLRHGGVKNFSGLIRVVCVMHLMKAARASRSAAPRQVFMV